MEKHICPRCGQNFPNWQPVHLRCLIARLKWVLIPLALLLLFFIITFIGPMIVDLAKTTTMEIAEAFPTKVSPTKKAVVPTVTIPSSSLYVTSTTTSRPTTTPSPACPNRNISAATVSYAGIQLWAHHHSSSTGFVPARCSPPGDK